MIRNLTVVGENIEASKDIIDELNTLEGYSVTFKAEDEIDITLDNNCYYIVDLPKGAFEIVRFINMLECSNVFVNVRSLEFDEQKSILRKSLDYRVLDCFLPPFTVEQFLLKKKATYSKEGALKDQILKQMGTMAVITDRSYEIIYVNDSLCNESGYDRDELLGQNLSILRTDSHSLMLYNNIQYTIESGMHWHGVLKNKRKDHSIYWENANIFSIVIDDEVYYCKSSINITQNEKIASENKRAEKMAIAVQNAMLPNDVYDDNIILRSFYKPLESVSGDIFSWYEFEDGKYAIFLADVIGHGIGSALMTTSIIATIRGLINESPEPDRLLYNLNNTIIDLYKLNDLTQSSYFSAAYLVIDTINKKIHHANCGHPKVYIIDEELSSSQTPNFLIGLFKDSEYDYKTFSYKPGTELLLYTDGLVELDGDDVKAGARDLEEKLALYMERDNEINLINFIENQIIHFIDEPKDDLTVLAVKLT